MGRLGGVLILPSLFFLLLPGFFLLQRKKWAWTYATIILFIGIAIFTYVVIDNFLFFGFESDFLFFIFPLVILLPSFILLLLDRKNYWETAVPSMVGYEPIIKITKAVEKGQLSTGRRIAGWIMVVFGGCGILGGLGALFFAFLGSWHVAGAGVGIFVLSLLIIGFILVFIGSLLFICGLLLLRRKI